MALAIRGMNYDTGTEFVRGDSTRARLTVDELEFDFLAIRDELHCNSINLYGTDLHRIVSAAELALAMGLHVSLQLRSIDAGKSEALERIALAAAAAQRLDTRANRVTLNLACEITLFNRGFLPGNDFLRRIANLSWSWPLLPLANAMLGRFMQRATTTARAAFAGPITYSAGSWERVNWSMFDFVGLDLYRDKDNQTNYAEILRSHFRHGKPVLITEFGCCTYAGAEHLGGGGWLALDWMSSPPRIKPGHVRSEAAQAKYLDELLALYDAAGVHGAYVYDFVQPQLKHSSDPRYDLDMASYGIVKAIAGRNDPPWQRKAAFEIVAQRYDAFAKTPSE